MVFSGFGRWQRRLTVATELSVGAMEVQLEKLYHVCSVDHRTSTVLYTALDATATTLGRAKTTVEW